MATTITEPTQPKHWIPSGNPIVYNFYTNNTLPDLSYIIDVIINGSVVCQLKYAVYDRNDMNIDFNRIVNDYIKDGWTNDYNVFNYTFADTLKLELKVYEQNGNNAPVASGSSKEIYVWYAVADFQKSRYLWDYYTYNDLTGTTYDQYGRFLGVQNYCEDVAFNSVLYYNPYSVEGKSVIFNNLYKISPTTKRSMSFFVTSTFTGGSKHTRLMNCWCYNKHHKMTKRFGIKLHNGTWMDSDYDRKIATIPVGIQELNAFTWDDIELLDGTLNYIDPSEDAYYFITVGDYSDMATTLFDIEWHTPSGYKWVGFEIVPCNQYKVYNILYQTSEGGWWQIRCDRKHSKETKVETNIKYNSWYPTSYGTFITNDATFKQVMHTSADGSITLNTNWIENQGIISEIEDMIISPRIFLVEDTELGAKSPVYTPVLLKDSTYQVYDKGQDRLFRYEFEFEEGFKKPTLK
jgi:hypothetical protein